MKDVQLPVACPLNTRNYTDTEIDDTDTPKDVQAAEWAVLKKPMKQSNAMKLRTCQEGYEIAHADDEAQLKTDKAHRNNPIA